MLARNAFLSATFVLGGLHAAAAPVRVALDWPSGMPASPRIHIQAVRAVGAANNGSTIQTEADAGPDGAVLDLGDGVWQVRASAPGYWSQETEVTVARQAPASVRLALWPAASLHGEILPAEGESLPDVLEVQLSAIPASAGEASTPQAPVAQPQPSPLHAQLRCRIDKGSFNCLGPSGRFDVRLEAAGYAPRYVWAVSLTAAENADLGPTQLRRVASVFGRAVRKDGSDPPGPCHAILQADVQRRSGPEPDPDAAPQGEASFSVPLTPSGYFQVVGVLPGRHRLSIECQAASGLRELIVQADSENRIDPPMELEELTLEIAVSPKLDPAGKPWQITVDAATPPPRRIADKVTASGEGRWIRRGLMAGNYRVSVSSSGGMSWLQQYFDLGPGSGPLSLRLASVRVAGRVLLGAEPVRARLVFFNNAGGEPVALNSDDEGRFQGLLPIAPEVHETSWTVEVHGAHPPVNRCIANVNVRSVPGPSAAWLDLTLPMLAVRGSVVSENGQPHPGIQVTVQDSGSGTQATTTTDGDGGFEMPDLPPGKYTAVAESDDGASDRTPFEVVDGSEKELKLIFHPFRRVSFYVVSNGDPVADAAVQVWIPPGAPRAFAHTNRNGRFQVSLPPGTTEVGLTVGEPGYALKMLRLPVPSENDPSPNANNTVSLANSGGSLQLNFQPPDGALPSSAQLFLVHNGAVQDARTVAGWGSNQTGASSEDQALVEAIDPGDYSLCVLNDPAEIAALWQGTLPTDRCRTGSVEIDRTLTLSPPAASTQ